MKNVNFKQFFMVVCLVMSGVWAQAQIFHGQAGTVTLTPGQVTTYEDSGTNPDLINDLNEYNDNEHITMTICPAAGENLVVNFTTWTAEAGFDGMLIFDGATNASPAIAGPDAVNGFGASGCVFASAWSAASPGALVSSGGCVTFEFCSDSSVSGDWSAAVSSAPAPLFSQCDPPINGTESNVLGTSTTFSWESVNPSTVDHCWNFYIGNIGFDCDEGEAMIEATVCDIHVAGAHNYTSNNPLVTLVSVDHAVGGLTTIDVTGLIPGTFYEWNVFEICDGNPDPNAFDCDDTAFGPFQTWDDPFTVTTAITPATCPSISPGFTPDGSFDITIGDSPSCAGVYDINVAGPFALLPAAHLGVAAGGPYSFTNAGPGTYTVVITETSVCHPANDPETITIVVPEGTDSQDATFYVFDVLGNILVDNDGGTPELDNIDFGTYDLPEGSCNYQEEWFVFGFDNCDGVITAAGAVTSTSVTLPATIFPATNTSVTDDGFGNYRVDVNWSVGSSVVTVCMTDAAGNTPCVTLERFLDDWGNPDIAIVGANNTVIPQCATTRDIIVTVYVDADCDQSIDESNIVFNTPGSPQAINFVGNGFVEYVVTVDLADNLAVWSASYSDGIDVGFADVQITVVQAATDEDPLVFAADDNMSIPHCADDALYCYSFQVYDDCAPITIAGVTFDDGGAGIGDADGAIPVGNLGGFTFIDDSNPNFVFFEVCGTIVPGNHIATASYQGQSVEPFLIINQEVNQDPTIILPGNLNFTIPVCTASMEVIFSIQVSDDCDDPINGANFTATLGGVVLVPSFTNGNGYFEFTETLDASNSGDLITASYQDADGGSEFVDALIVVNDQPDTWAPIVIYPSQDIFIDLDPCAAPSAIVSFDVTATDNCDGDLDPTSIQLLSAGGTLLNNTIIDTPGGDSYILLLSTGTYQILITAVDAAGNVREEDFWVYITQDAAPVDNIGCLPGVNITLDDNCEAVLDFELITSGNPGCLDANSFIITAVDSDISNGPIVDGCGTFDYYIETAFPTTVGFTGDFAPLEWTTQISSAASIAFAADGSSVTFNSGSTFGPSSFALMAMAVPDDGNISFDWEYDGNDAGWDFFGWVLDDNGTVVSSFLTTVAGNGSFNETVEAGYGIVLGIETPFDAAVASEAIVSNFVFVPAQGGNFTECWGTFTAEDKTVPTISCPSDASQVTYDRDVQFISGALATSDAQMNTANYACFLDWFNPVDGDHYYDTYSFSISNADNTPDYFTFEMNSSWGDAAAVLYQGAFNPDSPCENVIAQADDFGIIYPGGFGAFQFGTLSFDPTIRMSIALIPGATYTLLTTSWGTDVTGTYTWSVYTDGNSSIVGVPVQSESFTYDLICDDIDQVLITGTATYATYGSGVTIPGTMDNSLKNILDLTGYPTIWDNCGDVWVEVSDETAVNGDCGDVVITRTFNIHDRYNKCDGSGQAMTATCTQLITVRKPGPQDLVVPPITVFLECDEGFATLANGNPDPIASGFPSIQTAFGVNNLDEVYCTYAANYVDANPIDICASGYKLARTWSIHNWCDPAPIWSHVQVIKVGDFTAPELECIGDNVYSTGPYDCTANFPIPPITVTDNCSDYEVAAVAYILDDSVAVYNQFNQIVGYTTEKVIIGEGTVGTYVTGAAKGFGVIVYTVTDDCGNEAVLSCPFEVKDLVAPVAVCDDDLHISIGGLGYARVYATDIDEGSYDNCTDLRLEVRREGGQWGEYVELDCDDVHNEVRIELRVWDDANMNGIWGDWYGNPNHNNNSAQDDPDDLTNLCWLDVLIEDKINPYCYAPDNEWRHCDDDELLHIDWNDFDQLDDVFGAATATDNCNAEAEQVSVSVQLNDCGWGTVTRTFRAVDDWGLTSLNGCQQIISIYEVHDYEIKFPKDASNYCGVANPDTINYNTLACDLITVNVNDEPYAATSDECYKILRTYKVINWCEWDGESDPIVVGRDEDCNGTPGDTDIWVIVRTTWNGALPIYDTYFDRDNNEASNPANGNNRCQYGNPLAHGHYSNSTYNPEIASEGHWQYTQVIKVYDNEAPTAEVTADPNSTTPAGDEFVFCSDYADCTGDVSITFVITELCDISSVTYDGVIDTHNDGVYDGPATIVEDVAAATATTRTFTISGNYEIGGHRFGVHYEDGCNNDAWLEIPFEIVDCKAPTPICIAGLTVTLMPQPDGCCAMAIWASDFIGSAITDCTEPIKYSIIELEDDILTSGTGGTDIPSQDQTGIVLDCNDNGTVQINIYAWDSAYNPYSLQPDGSMGGPNYDRCQTFVSVQNHVSCPIDTDPARIVAGTITTENSDLNQAIEGVDVELSGNTFQNALTGNDGAFLFPEVPVNFAYTITPHLDVPAENSISTFDLVLITKHILGIALLDSPYKIIAADVNSSETVTTADMIQLRKLILGVYSEYPNNTFYRFVDADYDFPVATNPWAEAFPEVRNIAGLQENELLENFIGVVIGDVNGSAVTNYAGDLEERTVNGLFTLTTENVSVKAGTDYSVSFTAADLAKVAGYQFTLTFDQTVLNLTDIEYGVAVEENFGLNYVSEGMITTSWNGEAADDAVLFTLVFHANAEAQLSDVIGISSRITLAEAYDNNGLLDVAINFNGEVAAAGFEVYQNTPNPFSTSTKVGFSLPEDAAVTVTIQDVTGKTLQLVNVDGTKGYNTVTLKANGATGVLYYTVSTDNYTATKKMIVVE